MTYQEFSNKRKAYLSAANSAIPYLNVENDFDHVTKLAYKFYLKGRVPSWAS